MDCENPECILVRRELARIRKLIDGDPAYEDFDLDQLELDDFDADELGLDPER